MRDLRYGVKDLANKSVNSVGEYAQATTRYVSEQPLKSALIAAAVGAAVSLFYHKKEGTDDAGVALIYNNRFFMTLQPEAQVWRLGKIELAMSKVYHGTAEELLDLSVKILSGRSKPPEPRADFKAFTKDILDVLPPPPKEGEKWAEFDAAKALKAP